MTQKTHQINDLDFPYQTHTPRNPVTRDTFGHNPLQNEFEKSDDQANSFDSDDRLDTKVAPEILGEFNALRLFAQIFGDRGDFYHTASTRRLNRGRRPPKAGGAALVVGAGDEKEVAGFVPGVFDGGIARNLTDAGRR